MADRLCDWLRSHPRIADLAALGAGAGLVLAFGPFEWRWVALASPAVLIYLWSFSSARVAFRYGYLFGLGLFGTGVSWVFNSIYEYGQAPALLAGVIALAFVLFLALYPALSGALAIYLFGRSRPSWFAFGVPSVWTIMEWLRSWILTGFPWILMGQAHIDTPLRGVIPVFGTLGASWLSVATSSLLVFTLVAGVKRAWWALAGVLVLWASAIGLAQMEWTKAQGVPIQVSVVQGNIAQGQKWNPEHLGPTMARYAALTQEHWDSALIVWPETAIPVLYSEVANSYFEPLAEEARAHGSQIVTGIFTEDPATGRPYNSVVLLGDTPSFYSKRHLVPFGEFLPLRQLLNWMDGLIQIPMADLGRGRSRPLLMGAGPALGVSVCYEAAYGNEVIEALPEAELLINVSNDGWFGDSLAPHQHLEIARLRALESGRYLLRATNTGISAIIDDQGHVTTRSPQFQVDVLTTEVVPRRGSTPYAIWGNWGPITVLIFGMVIIWSFLWRDRLARRSPQAAKTP